MRRQILSMLFTVALLVSVQAAEDPKPVAVDVAESPPPVAVTFYHSSDLHEHSAPMVRIAGFVAAQKAENPNVLFVDTGDWLNKGDLTELNTRGEAMTAMLGACRYDALIPGNHDYSFGTKRLAELIDKHSLPVVAANWEWPAEAQPKNVAAYRIFEFDGVTVAIVGTATPISTQKIDDQLRILPLEPTLQAMVADLDQRVDIIALLTHVGVDADRKLAAALPGVDIIFGGHHHRRFPALTFDSDSQTVIQHSGCNGNCLGELIVHWDGEKIVDRQVRLIDVDAQLPELPAVAAIRAQFVTTAELDQPATLPVAP